MRTLLLLLPIGFLLLGSLSARGQEGLDSARQALAESLPDVAATRLQAYLRANPKLEATKRFDILLLLGEALVRAGEPEKALLQLDELPDRLIDARNYWQGIALAHLHRHQEAIEKFETLKPSSELFAQATFNAIELHVSENEKDKAFALIKVLRNHDAEYRTDELAFLEAQIFLAEGKLTAARKALSPALGEEKAPSSKQLLLGQIELADEQPEEALAAFASLLNQSTKIAVQNLALLGQSDALAALGRNEEALATLVKLLRSESVDPLLELLPARFEALLAKTDHREDFTKPLETFVQPETLGEDSNYATSPKLLACYYLASSSGAEAEKTLLQLITKLSPAEQLAARAHLRLGELAWQKEDWEGARTGLEKAKTIAPQSPQAAVANELLARLSVKDGDPEEARKLFAKAAEHPDQDFAEKALLNEAILQLADGPGTSISALASRLNSEESQVALALEKALALARKKSPQAAEALENFIEKHPDHPRVVQARLMFARVLLDELQPDFAQIENQLASLPAPLSQEFSRESFRLSHRLGAITNNWDEVVVRGEEHRRNFPEAENDPYFLLRLAESCFRNGDFNRARFLFAKTASLPEVGELAEVALYYGARANLVMLVPEATEEGLEILDKLVARSGPLATEARLLKARVLLKNLGQAEDCLAILEDIPGDPGDQPEAALLSAQAYRELATNKPELFKKAISLYEQLLDDERTTYQRSNQIHYLLAQTYRESGQPNLAIDPCLAVVDRQNRAREEKEEEWEYYYRCGFEAIDILLEANRARAALILARKLAQTKGPGAEQAKVRAEQIQLDHLLWTD